MLHTFILKNYEMKKSKILIFSISAILLISCGEKSMPDDLVTRKNNLDSAFQNLGKELENIKGKDIQALIKKCNAVKIELEDYTNECNKRGISKNNDEGIRLLNQSIEELKSKIPPPEFLNKPLYESPYFVCRDNLFIDNDLNFTYTIYSIGTMSTAGQTIVKGKLNSDGSITFNGSNKYQFQENYMPTEILAKWDLNNSCYGDAKCISLYSKFFNTLKGGYEVSNHGFSTEKCTPGY